MRDRVINPSQSWANFPNLDGTQVDQFHRVGLALDQYPSKLGSYVVSRGHRSEGGFTLIELMVALVIFAILSSVAIPLYTSYSERGYRTELTSDLLTCAQAIERFSATNFTYVGITADGAADGALSNNICNPRSVQQGRYSINVATTATTYLLTATPQGSMAGNGAITLDQVGNRTWDEGNDGVGVHDNDWNED